MGDFPASYPSLPEGNNSCSTVSVERLTEVVTSGLSGSTHGGAQGCSDTNLPATTTAVASSLTDVGRTQVIAVSGLMDDVMSSHLRGVPPPKKITLTRCITNDCNMFYRKHVWCPKIYHLGWIKPQQSSWTWMKTLMFELESRAHFSWSGPVPYMIVYVQLIPWRSYGDFFCNRMMMLTWYLGCVFFPGGRMNNTTIQTPTFQTNSQLQKLLV